MEPSVDNLLTKDNAIIDNSNMMILNGGQNAGLCFNLIDM